MHIEAINLYSLYNDFAITSNLKSSNDKEYSWIKNPNLDWPNYIYNVRTSKETCDFFVSDLAERILRREIPPLIIIDQFNFNFNLEESFEKHGLRKIDIWPVMSLENNNTNFQGQIFDNKYTTKIISNESEFINWYKIVQHVLYPKKRIDIGLFRRLNNKKALFLLGYYDSKPVSTLMLYIHDGIAGIYQVATIESHRRLGIGKQITLDSIELLKEMNINKVTLQSSRMAFKIYKNIGFREIFNLDIYWMVGNNFK